METTLTRLTRLDFHWEEALIPEPRSGWLSKRKSVIPGAAHAGPSVGVVCFVDQIVAAVVVEIVGDEAPSLPCQEERCRVDNEPLRVEIDRRIAEIERLPLHRCGSL